MRWELFTEREKNKLKHCVFAFCFPSVVFSFYLLCLLLFVSVKHVWVGYVPSKTWPTAWKKDWHIECTLYAYTEYALNAFEILETWIQQAVPQGSLSILAQSYDTVAVDFLAAHSCCEHPVPPDPKGTLLGLDVGNEVKLLSLFWNIFILQEISIWTRIDCGSEGEQQYLGLGFKTQLYWYQRLHYTITLSYIYVWLFFLYSYVTVWRSQLFV